MKVGIYGQFYHKGSEKYIQLILQLLQKHNIEICIEEEFFKKIIAHKAIKVSINKTSTFNILDATFQFFISIGGDGTLLKSATFVKDLNIPIVGINTGRLGFLATIPKEELTKHLLAIIKGNFTLSERSLVIVETTPPHPDLKPLNFALNEVAINRKNTTSMIKVETHLNNEYLTSYWSDGLIIATPTGSTGYSLSCGGPVIDPNTKSLVITPIAPHNLNARPFVIPDYFEISLKISGRENSFLLSLDSRIVTLNNKTTVKIKKAPFSINMVQLEGDTFLNTLRQKLLWGEDKRN